MDTLWPWLAIAAVGALHGLNPATGWWLATAWSLRTQERHIPLRALLPMAVGHVASVALVAAAAVWSLSMARPVLLSLAGGLAALVVLAHVWGHAPRRMRPPAGPLGMALWSFGASTAHGGGLALVPALVPPCLGSGDGGGAAQAPLLWALAALAVHTVAMLVASAAMAAAGCRAVQVARQWRQRRRLAASGPAV